MYTNIVVGTDGSARADEAVRHAARLASATGATLHIVHAFQIMPALASMAPEVGAAAWAGLAEGADERARHVLAGAEQLARAEGAKVEGHLCTGDAADALVDTSERLEADLLVIGNKGMSGVKRFMLGSVPNKVSHHCPCSLLIVDTAR